MYSESGGTADEVSEACTALDYHEKWTSNPPLWNLLHPRKMFFYGSKLMYLANDIEIELKLGFRSSRQE